MKHQSILLRYTLFISFLLHSSLILCAIMLGERPTIQKKIRKLAIISLQAKPTFSPQIAQKEGVIDSSDRKNNEEIAKIEEPLKATENRDKNFSASSSQNPLPQSIQKKTPTNTPSSSIQKKKNSLSPSQEKKEKGKSVISNIPSQSLLEEALHHLDSAKSPISSRKIQSSSIKGSTNSSSLSLIGPLQSEADGFFSSSLPHESSSMNSSYSRDKASSEEWYAYDLIRRIRLSIRLKEPGSVKLLLTLQRDGTCLKVEIIHSTTGGAKIKKELEQSLQKIKYSSFGSSFQGEKEHTFRLKIEDDGTY